VGNEIDQGHPASDYDGLIELQDELNAKQTQLARVIALHADPAMGFPMTAFDSQGNIHANRKAFAFVTKDDLPAYVTWDAQLAAAMADRDAALTAFCMAAELSQGLLGLDKGGVPDSARKLRLQATKTLARVKRKSKFIKPFIRTAIDTALMMTRAGRVVKVAMGLGDDGTGTAVDLRDGLPIDELDQANTLSILTGAKPVMSVDRAVRTQLTDPEAADKELAILEKEAAAAAPTVAMTGALGEPGEQPGEPAGGQPSDPAVPQGAAQPAAGGVSDDEYTAAA
jgi:hypothetical protein